MMMEAYEEELEYGDEGKACLEDASFSLVVSWMMGLGVSFLGVWGIR